MTLLQKLLTADTVCSDCGNKYGKYSVGCSSVWNGTCGVCGEDKPVTEVRDYGYLSKGINELKGRIKEQSLEVANYMKCQEEIASQEEDESVSYEQGEIACMFTEDEIDALVTAISDVYDKYPQGQDAALDTAWEKIIDLYEDHCIKYELSPVMKAYHEKYGTFGIGEDQQRWEGFRDAFELLNSK